jgi:Arm DNA-binding domain
MPVIRFTDISLRSLKEGFYLDERTPAFGIRIGKNRKTWLVLKEPNRTKVRLGHYPAISLADARKKALVALGSPHKQTFAPTFPDTRTEYLAQGKWRPYSRYQVTRTLNRHFHWTKPLDKITHRDVAEAIEAISAPSEAAHAFKDIRSFFNWCVPRYLTSSPCTGLKPPSRYIPRERVLTDSELRAIWHAVDPDHPYGVTIRLLILLGQRLGETSKMNESWLDGTTLTIPAAVTKNGRQHVIPISGTAQNLIHKLRPFVGWGKYKTNLAHRLNLPNWTHHDLRRTYATNIQRLGVRLEVTEALLNHVSGTRAGIVGTYQRHDFFPEMKEAVEQYEQFLQALLAVG